MTEQLYHVGVKAVIRNAEGKILLLGVHQDRMVDGELLWAWDLPGGRIQKGNDARAALRLELFEEIGYEGPMEAKQIGSCFANKLIPSEHGQLGLVLFAFEVSIGDLSVIKLSPEHESSEWCDIATAKTRLAAKYPEEFLRNL